MKKILICAPIHPKNDIRVYYKEALSLLSKYENVTLIARDNDYEINDKIKFRSVSKPYNFKDRVLNLYKIYKIMKEEKFDVYHFHNPDTILLAFLMKIKGYKVIYDTHENFSKRILMRDWIPKLLRYPTAKLVEGSEIIASKFLDMVIVTQLEQLKKYKNKTILIENPPLLDEKLQHKAHMLSQNIHVDNNTIYLLYAGGISKPRGILEILDVLLILNNKDNKVVYKLWLLGTFLHESFRQELEEHKAWEYVYFKGHVSQEETYAHMIKANIGLVTIHDIGDHANTSPNKLFEYATYGLPFIASDFPKWKDKLSNTQAGIFVNPNDIETIAESIILISHNKDLSDFMGENGNKFVRNEYNWHIEENKLIEGYERILSKGR